MNKHYRSGDRSFQSNGKGDSDRTADHDALSKGLTEVEWPGTLYGTERKVGEGRVVITYGNKNKPNPNWKDACPACENLVENCTCAPPNTSSESAPVLSEWVCPNCSFTHLEVRPSCSNCGRLV